ncbi:MAG: hypothetical protein ACOC32_03080 [Nanoarchaeota archaeon]
MFLDVISVLVKLAAAFYLLIAGVLLHFDAKKKKSVKLWSKGLIVLTLVVLVDLFALGGQTNEMMYIIRRLLLDISMIIFFFHGTLLFFLREKYANILTGTYFLGAVAADFTLNAVSGNIYLNLAMHHVYVVFPLAVVFFAYFYTYYIELKEKVLMKLSLSWGFLFLTLLIVIIVGSMELAKIARIVIIIEYLAFTYMSFKFNELRKAEDHIWHKVTTPKHYVIDHNFLDFMTKEFGGAARKAIEQEMAKENAESIYSMTEFQQEQFLDNLMINHFPEQSAQRKAIIKTKAIEMLGLRQDSGHWRTAAEGF